MPKKKEKCNELILINKEPRLSSIIDKLLPVDHRCEELTSDELLSMWNKINVKGNKTRNRNSAKDTAGREESD